MRPLLSNACGARALAFAVLAGCATAQGVPSAVGSVNGAQSERATTTSLPKHALIAFDTQSGALGYWPIQSGSGKTLTPFTNSLGIYDGYALAGNGDIIIIANYKPAEVVTYNVKTKAQATMADPYGDPLDVAVGKNGTIYAMNSTNVAVYESGSTQPSELTCSHINNAEAVAVNNEGAVFVDGYGGSFAGVVEYPVGSTTCTVPDLRPTQGYIAGVGVDPKTDDLVVIDDPGLCAGGLEGRMVIYPKPYNKRHSTAHDLSATYCAGTFRLGASSKHIFYADATVSAGFPLIDEAQYPSGKYVGTYENGYYSGGNFFGFTTIPNRLPN